MSNQWLDSKTGDFKIEREIVAILANSDTSVHDLQIFFIVLRPFQ